MTPDRAASGPTLPGPERPRPAAQRAPRRGSPGLSTAQATGAAGGPGGSIGLRGYLLSSPGVDQLAAWPDGALLWDELGTIQYAGPWSDRPRPDAVSWHDCRGFLITPGFVDVHCHLPQYRAVGQGGLQLLPWLERYIFPLEKRFTPEQAALDAPRFFAELKKHGITSAAVYPSAAAESTEVCFQAAAASGLRVVMGQVMMDEWSYLARSSPELTRRIVAESGALCRRWHGAAGGLVQYAFSPRFALTCSFRLMRETAELAGEAGAFIQTHLAENRGELQAVREKFPDACDYTNVYERCGLLGPRTILAHAIYLSEREHTVLAEADAKIAHCPTSNVFLGSGVLDWQRTRFARIGMGLGSDVAGGPELNPWQVMKGASYSHRLRVALTGSGTEPSLVDLFRMATVDGARILAPGHALGQLAPGFTADVAVWDIAHVDAYDEPLLTVADPQLILSKLVYRGAQATAAQVYVAGQAT
ncbi:MAG TPA: amidohydrolase family protein [Chthoniobacterales bacterium]